MKSTSFLTVFCVLALTPLYALKGNFNRSSVLQGVSFLAKRRCPKAPNQEDNDSINKQDMNGETSQMLAVRSCREEVIEVLVKNGARIGLEDKQGNNILVRAIARDNDMRNLPKYIFEPANDSIVQDALVTLILALAGEEPPVTQRTFAKIVDFLIEKGARIDKPDSRKRMALLVVVKLNEEGMVKALVERSPAQTILEAYDESESLPSCSYRITSCFEKAACGEEFLRERKRRWEELKQNEA